MSEGEKQMNISKKDLEKALRVVESSVLLKNCEVLPTIEAVLQEKISEQKDNWRREPEEGGQVYVLWGNGDIDINKYYVESYNVYYDKFAVFPLKDGYTKEQLIADHVADMGFLERMAYQFGHYYGDWLTDEERRDLSLEAYSATYDLWFDWHTCLYKHNYRCKWYHTKKTTDALCEYLNANCDHTGHLK